MNSGFVYRSFSAVAVSERISSDRPSSPIARAMARAPRAVLLTETCSTPAGFHLRIFQITRAAVFFQST